MLLPSVCTVSWWNRLVTIHRPCLHGSSPGSDCCVSEAKETRLKWRGVITCTGLVCDSSSLGCGADTGEGRAARQTLDNPEIDTEGNTTFLRDLQPWQRTSRNARAFHGLPKQREVSHQTHKAIPTQALEASAGTHEATGGHQSVARTAPRARSSTWMVRTTVEELEN